MVGIFSTYSRTKIGIGFWRTFSPRSLFSSVMFPEVTSIIPANVASKTLASFMNLTKYSWSIGGINSSPLKFDKVFDNSNFEHREMKYTTADNSYKFRKKTDVVTEWKDCSCPNKHWGTYSVEEDQHFEGKAK